MNQLITNSDNQSQDPHKCHSNAVNKRKCAVSNINFTLQLALNKCKSICSYEKDR